MSSPTFDKTRRGYTNLWETAFVKQGSKSTARSIANKLLTYQTIYRRVADIIGCPWWFIAIVHQMESNASFSKHLHNGDSLARRTVQVPAGRPKIGNPPFTWEESALDALRMKGLDKIDDWIIPRALYEWERYNGWGYFGKINSPYLWSYTNHYTAGKYIADHVYSSSAVSKQCGAAAILKTLVGMGV